LPQAEATARGLLKHYPKALVLHSVLGNSLIGQREFEQAEKSLSKVVSMKPDSLESWSALGYRSSRDDSRRPSAAIARPWH